MSEQGPYSRQPQENYGWGQTPPPPPPGTYPPYVNEEMIPTQRSSQPPPAYFTTPSMPPAYPVMPPSAPPEPPRLKHDRSLFIVIGLFVAVLLIVFGAVGTLVFMSWRTANNPTPPATQTITTNNPTQGPEKTPTVGKTPINTLNQRYPLGQTVNGKIWQITANNVRTSNGDDFLKASKGKIFVLIDVTVKNVSPRQETVSSLLMFKLRGADEVEYIESITTFNKPPDGDVAPGATIKGTLAFEVPAAQRDFLFVFLPEPISGKEEVIWEVRVAK